MYMSRPKMPRPTVVSFSGPRNAITTGALERCKGEQEIDNNPSNRRKCALNKE
jgi:hypothetical protein